MRFVALKPRLGPGFAFLERLVNDAPTSTAMDGFESGLVVFATDNAGVSGRPTTLVKGRSDQ